MVDIISDLQFIQRGLVAGIIVSLICPIIGSFLVVKRLSLMSEALSHFTLTGVALGLLITNSVIVLQWIDPLYVGLLFAFIGAFFIEKIRLFFKHYQEISIPVLLSFGVGLSVILFSMANGFNAGLLHFLFGSIVSVTQEDVQFIIFTCLLALLLVMLFYKELLSVSFDEEFAKISGVRRKGINLVFALVVALTISVAMRVVGILLVSSLIVIPVAASLKIAKSFKQTILYGVLIAESSMLFGVIIAYYLEIATGGMVVVTAIAHLIVILLYQKGKKVLLGRVHHEH